MPPGNTWTAFLDRLPFKKLSHGEVANLIGDAMGMCFALLYADRYNNHVLSFVLAIAVLLLSYNCIFWASKQ